MKKLLALSLTCMCTAVSAQNLVKIKEIKYDAPAGVAYKTVKSTQVGYTISFYNFFEPSDDVDVDFPDKNGLYTYAMIDMGKFRPSSFPGTYPSVNPNELIKMLKISDRNVVAKFKTFNKKKSYRCALVGKMNAQFKVYYEGNDFIRFPSSQVWGEVTSATPVGQPKLECEELFDF